MLRSRPLFSVLFVSLLVLLMGARGVPLIDPEPIAVPSGVSLRDVGKAIKASLVGRNWVINEDNPGRIVSTLNLRTHMAKIEVAYDEKMVDIRYLDSGDLDYEDKKDGRYIHRNYLNWIKNIIGDISRNLQLMAP
jgi:hypothetical protein